MATLTHSQPEGTDLTLLTFAAPADDHRLFGQYVVVEHEGGKAFFALANAPGTPAQLLVKHHGAIAQWLVAQGPGAAVQMSAAKGPGFRLALDERPLLVLAAGSGLAAVRALVQDEVARGLQRPVALFYGALTPAHRSFVTELAAWRLAGVEVHEVFAEAPAEAPPGWSGATGFVQHAARDAGWLRPDLSLVLCGFPQMVEEARALWTGAGLEPERVLTNF